MIPGLLNKQQLGEAVDSFSNIKTGLVNNPDKQFCEIIRRYSADQITQINQAYYERHQQSISTFAQKMFKDDETKNLTLLVLAPRHDAWAKCIHIALEDMSENADLLVSALLMMEPMDVYKTKVAYKIRYNVPMDKDLKRYLKGKSFWEKLLLAWICRDEYSYVAQRFNVKKDAEKLYRATVGMGTDDSVYVDMFARTTPEEFRKIIAEYPNVVRQLRDAKHPENTPDQFLTAIDGEFSQKSLDNFCAKLAYHRLMDLDDALAFIFDNSFNEKTEYQEGAGGNLDKPMINFLLAVFRDRFEMTAQQKSKMSRKMGPFKGVYYDSVLGYFGLK